MKAKQLTLKRKQQILIVIACLVYSFAYTGRYSYNANIAPIMAFYNVTRAEAGLTGTFFFFAYGAGQLIHAIFCRFYPRKYIIPGVLGVSAILNIAVFCGVPFGAIKYLWLLNGICQSVLWPTLVLVLSDTMDSVMMKQAVFAMSLTVVIGTVISYGGSAIFNLFDLFRGAFLLGAVLMVAIGIAWLIGYDVLTVENAGLAEAHASSSEATTAGGGSWKRAANGALIGLFAVCGLFMAVDNFVKDGLNTWTPVILKERFGVGDSLSIVLTVALPFCGVFGAMLALRMNRKIRDFRALSGSLLLLLSVCICGILLSMKLESMVLTVAFLGVVSCFAHGINSIMTSIMPFAMRDKVNPGFLAGLMNSAGYVGSTASAYGLGVIADRTDWNTVMYILLFASVGVTLLAWGTVLLGHLRKRRTGQET